MGSMGEMVTVLVFLLAGALRLMEAATPAAGSACTTASDCKSVVTFLSCRSGTCQCDAVSHFDDRQGICLVHTGGMCDITQKPGRTCVQNALCVSKRSTATKGKCECSKGYTETTLGICEGGLGGVGSSVTMPNNLMFAVIASVSGYILTTWSTRL